MLVFPNTWNSNVTHVPDFKFKSSGLFYTYFKPAHTLFCGIHTTCGIWSRTKDARKQHVCLNLASPHWELRDLQYEAVFMRGEIRYVVWRSQDCYSLRYKLLFLPCYCFSIWSIVSCTISQLKIKQCVLIECIIIFCEIYFQLLWWKIFREASGRILKIVMLTFFLLSSYPQTWDINLRTTILTIVTSTQIDRMEVKSRTGFDLRQSKKNHERTIPQGVEPWPCLWSLQGQIQLDTEIN